MAIMFSTELKKWGFKSVKMAEKYSPLAYSSHSFLCGAGKVFGH